MPLPAEPAQRATELLPRPPGSRRRLGRGRLAAPAALAAAAVAGLVAALLLATGGHAPRPHAKAHAVALPRAGADATEEARNLAAWIRSHSR
jgi:hypothetical protein